MKSCSRIQFNIKQRPSILLVRSFPGFRNIIAWQSIYAGRKNPENAMERLTFMHAIVAVEEYLPLLKSCESIDLLPRIFLTYFTRHKYLVKQTFLFLLNKSAPQSFLFSFATQIFFLDFWIYPLPCCIFSKGAPRADAAWAVAIWEHATWEHAT
jgi:hypothetical protein